MNTIKISIDSFYEIKLLFKNIRKNRFGSRFQESSNEERVAVLTQEVKLPHILETFRSCSLK